MIVFSVISTAEQANYTIYDDHNGELCHGLHVGDYYEYEIRKGSEEIYSNGTVNSDVGDSLGVFVIITEVPQGLIDLTKYSQQHIDTI